jgi:uncharacterized membrane protein
MSTAINDPASVVQALDAIEDLLSTLVLRDLAVGPIVDEVGSPKVVFDAPGWDEFLAAGADEIAETPMHPMVRRRLRTMLGDLLDIAPVERHPGIEQRIADLDTTDRWPPSSSATADTRS